MANRDLNTEILHDSGVVSMQFGAPAANASYTVLYLHGFPGSALEAAMLHAAAAEARVRVISVDRPGFGKSGGSNLCQSSIAQTGALIAGVMRDLQVTEYTIVAISGGAPYALATALAAPESVKKLVIVSGLGDLTRAGATDGMIAQNKLILKIAKLAPFICLPALRMIAEGWAQKPHSMICMMAKMLPGEDRHILLDPVFAAPFAASMQRGVLQGHSGGYAELRRLVRPWNLDLPALRCRIEIFHGDADGYVPLSHAQWLKEKVPHAKLTVFKDRGHFMAARMENEILAACLA